MRRRSANVFGGGVLLRAQAKVDSQDVPDAAGTDHVEREHCGLDGLHAHPVVFDTQVASDYDDAVNVRVASFKSRVDEAYAPLFDGIDELDAS